MVYADMEIINGEELGMARRGLIDQDEVKRLFINILVDTGSYMLAINESIQHILQLPVVERKRARLADGSVIECNVVSPVELRFKNRRSVCSALVLPGNTEPLLGAIPLKEMDVLIHPLRQELIVNPEHPDYAQLSLKLAR